jgi:two-component system, chemotaxis family, chemotaxis protein CheY
MAVDPTTPILIVDDYQAMVRIIRNLLHQLGFEQIDEAHDGEAALAKLKERSFGLVISDWNMEPMSGLELLERVRATPALEHLPFIMVTAETRDDRVARARQAGVSGYVVKPFNADTLSQQIANVIGR